MSPPSSVDIWGAQKVLAGRALRESSQVARGLAPTDCSPPPKPRAPARPGCLRRAEARALPPRDRLSCPGAKAQRAVGEAAQLGTTSWHLDVTCGFGPNRFASPGATLQS